MTASLRMLCLRAVPLLAFVGCGTVPTTMDAGTRDAAPESATPDTGAPDLGTPDMGIVYPPGTTCGATMAVTGSTTAMVSAPFDTTSDPPGMRDLGLHCGNADPMMGAGRFPPQEVIEYQVAGTGMQLVDFTTVNTATPMGFDTVVQVRTSCEMVPTDAVPFSCFDDTSATERRSTGGYAAMGGSTLFFFVTGFALDMPMTGITDRGRGRIDFTQHAAQAPLETMAQGFLVGGRLELDGTGTDADGDARGMVAHILDAAGHAVDVSGDGIVDGGDDIALAFLTSVDGMTSFSGTGQIATLNGATASAESVITAAGGTQAEVRIYDQGGLTSAPMTVPLTVLPEVGVGVACDAGHRCRLPATCGATTMTCDLPPAIAAACMGATAMAVPLPTTTTTTVMVTGSVPAGMGQFFGSCGQGGPPAATQGMEALYTVDVPAGHFDLIAGTEATAGGTTDTLVYVRSSCGDPGTEVACNDDINTAGMDYRSHVEIMDVTPMTTYTIFVEHWNGGAVSFSLHADLRPVLDAGATCDAAGRMNRCSGGACPASHVCP